MRNRAKPVSGLMSSQASTPTRKSGWPLKFYIVLVGVLTIGTIGVFIVFVPSTTCDPNFGSTQTPASKPYTAVVVGGTGGIGKELIQELVESTLCTKVTAVVRAPVLNPTEFFGISARLADKLVVVVIDFEKPQLHAESFKADKGFCCLGTTRAIAGSAEAFRKVDLDYVVRTALLMHQQGVQSFSLVTSMGASSTSSFLYPQTKGETEELCGVIGFKQYNIFRPGMLLVRREGVRSMDNFWQTLTPDKWSVPVGTVARSMRLQVEYNTRAGTFQFEHELIKVMWQQKCV